MYSALKDVRDGKKGTRYRMPYYSFYRAARCVFIRRASKGFGAVLQLLSALVAEKLILFYSFSIPLFSKFVNCFLIF